MHSFFGDDTAEEEKLVAKILNKKNEEDVDKLPQIIDEITTSHLVSSTIKKLKDDTKDPTQVKSEESTEDKDSFKEHITIMEKYSKEEKLNFNIKAHIFSFHIKKNGRINADLYFIPYKSQDNKNIITEYTYNYGYYDIYTKNIEQVNKSIHLKRLDKKRNLDETTTDVNEKENPDTTSIATATATANKKIRVKSEIEDTDIEVKVKTEVEQDKKKIEIRKEKNDTEAENFQKWLVHFRGRLFIGCEIVYSFFKINTFLATTLNRNVHDKSIEGFKMFDKKIQTYNLIKNAVYWKQDVYPDITDQNIQRLLFFLLVPSLNDIEKEEEALQDTIVF